MGVDDQREEREVLDSIFPDEIHDISEVEYRISIKLDVPDSRDDDDIEPRESELTVEMVMQVEFKLKTIAATIILSVQYPPDYPDVAPILDLNYPPNAPKYVHLDIQSDKEGLLASLSSTIEENIGIAMVFTLVSTIKENAEQLILERAGAEQARLDVEAAKAEEIENAKFHGTSVNRESFLKWRDGFVEEMKREEERKVAEREAEELRKRRGAAGPKDEGRMTGRELWEKGLAGKGEDDGDEDTEQVGGIKEGMEKIKIAE